MSITLTIASAGPSTAQRPHKPIGFAWPDKGFCGACSSWCDGTPEGWRTLIPNGETWQTDDPSTYTLGGFECEVIDAP